MTQNMQEAMARASQNAKAPSATEKRDQDVATGSKKVARVPEPTVDFAAQFAAMQEMMKQLADTNAQLLAQNTALKAGKAAPKAEKPAPTPENMGISIKGNIMTITIDLSKDTGKDTANGANRIVAQQNSAVGPYKFTHAGKDHWLSCSVGRPYDNAAELRKLYKASKPTK